MPKPSDEEILEKAEAIHRVTMEAMIEFGTPRPIPSVEWYTGQLLAIRDATWDAALEEAAGVADRISNSYAGSFGLVRHNARDIAYAIHALKEKP